MTDEDFNRHLHERQGQQYASTRLWAPNPHLIGMVGERALATFFGAQQDFTNKPGGDGGCDLQVKLDLGETARWFNVDAKCATHATHLLVNRLKIKPKTIYVLVRYGDPGECLGWEWGRTLMPIEPVNWLNNGAFVHAKPVAMLRDMAELTERYRGWRHSTVGARTDDHLCHCGAYGTFSVDNGETLKCREHDLAKKVERREE
jgi:hypothetical protein